MYRLRRVSRKESRILGVCGGISKYIDPEIDPAMIRILWTIITIFAIPLMVILYLILGIVLKREEITK